MDNHWLTRGCSQGFVVSHDERGSLLRPADFLGVFQSPSWAFTEQAFASLEPLISACGEFLSLDCDNRTIFLFNCTCCVDALDEQLSAVDRFEDGRIYALQRFVPLEGCVATTPIFRIPFSNLVFVTDEFVTAEQSTNLTGLQFIALD